MTDIGSHPRM